METQNGSLNDNQYVSVIGSAISTICFFAPWVGCGGFSKISLSGADIADLNGEFWIVFATSLVSLSAFIFFKSQNMLSKARTIISICSVTGIGFLLYKFIQFQGKDLPSSFQQNIDIKWGLIATVAGYFISLIGVVLIEKEDQSKIELNENKEKEIFCANCGKKYPAESAGKYCEECGTII